MKNIYIVTGTSRGLGKALLKKIQKNEDNMVVSISRNHNIINQSNVSLFDFDLKETKMLPSLVDLIFSTIDFTKTESITLINNAGVLSPIKSIQDASVEEITENLDVNLKSLIILTSLFIAKTKNLDLKKAIVNVSSGAASKGYDGWSVYCAAKAGVDNFTRSVGLEQERQKYPVKILSFYPGVIDTDMQRLIRNTQKNDFPALDRFIGYKESGSLLKPEFAAKKLLDLSNSNFQNGEIYNIENL